MLRTMTCLLVLCVFGAISWGEDEADLGKGLRDRRPAPPTVKLSGRFLFDGVPPVRPLLEISAERRTRDGKEYRDADSERFAKLKITDDTLIVGADRGLQNVVIWISDQSLPIPPVPPVRRIPNPATLTFKEGRLQPRVLAWWADQRLLQLVNEDVAPLNVQWDGRANNGFNQLLSPGKPVNLQIKPERIPTPIKSSIYPWLQPAILFPCAHPYFAVTDAEGYFSMSDLPPGNWEFRAWHERCGWIKTADWPKGKYTVAIKSGSTDLGTIKVSPTLFELKSKPVATVPNAPPRVQSTVERPGWKVLGEQRRAANERDGAAEWAGTWRLHLPAGFDYDVTLAKTADGLLQIDGAKKINLLGTFAFTQKQLRLVKPFDDGIDDFIWQLNDEGQFVLITDHNRAGARYQGASLTRTK